LKKWLNWHFHFSGISRLPQSRKRKRSREELVQGKSEEINIENGDSGDVKPEKKKKCPNKNLILGLIQFILVSGTMAFFIYNKHNIVRVFLLF
jgi:hypothetical protein